MKSITFVILLFILIGACSAKESNNSNNIEKESQNLDEAIFKDKFGGYMLSYPAYWKLDDHSASEDLIRADIYKDNIVGFQIRMYSTKDFHAFTDSYIKNFMSEMQGHWEGTIKEEKREFTGKKGHEKCKVWIYAEKQNGERWLFKEYLFQNNDKIITFQSGIYFPYKNLYETELDKIALSFKFI